MASRSRKHRREPRRRPRRAWLMLGAVVFAGVGVWAVYRAGWIGHRLFGPKLNLLLITLDTTRPDYLGCYGASTAATPNLDQLAAEGTRFAHCSTCVPLTLPSHASIMTAVCPNVHNARRNGTSHVSAANQTLAETLLAAGYHTRAAVASFVLNRQFGLGQGFEVYHDVQAGAAADPLQAERRADAVCDDAINLLQSAGKQRFFLWVHFYDPHYPYESPRHSDHSSPAAYADEVSFMDEHIGRLLHELRRLGLENSTLVVAVGDHGEGLGQHDEPTHGYFLYETTLHVPLIIRCPGEVPAGSVVTQPVRTIDVAPTILALLGCTPLPNVEGTSLAPLLRGHDLPSPLPSYAETFEANVQFGLSPLHSFRLGDWKLVLAPKSELYDLASDPGEEHDLALQQPKRVAELRDALRAFVADAPPPVPADALADLSAEDVKRLRSLGYVETATSLPSDARSQADLLKPHGGNPRDFAGMFEVNSEARASLAERRFSAAEQLFREVIKALPGAPQPYAGLAEALGGQRQMPKALEAMRVAVSRAPDDLYIRSAYGTLLSSAGRWDAAVDQFRIVLQRMPHDTVVLHNMGVALAFLGRLDEAEENFQLALSIEPDSPRLLHAMGVLRSRQGRFAEAATYLRQAVALDPHFEEAAVDLKAVESRLHP